MFASARYYKLWGIVLVQKFQCVDVSTKDPRTVVLMLDSPEPVVVCKACDAIHKYIEKCEQQ